MAMPSISVIIVNYNGKAFLQAALNSLMTQTFQDFEVLLVDNASSDGSLNNLETSALPRFSLLAQDENLGFAAANNLAAQQANGTWLALMNPDTIAHDDWLEQIISATERHPGVNMFACAQLALEQSDTLDGAGDCYLGFGIPWRGGYGRPLRELPGEGECFSPCGASAVFRRRTFLKHHGFDERFFCYCEDVDLGYRMRLAGERCVFLPDAIIQHAGSGISGEASPFSLFHGTRNRLWTYVKNTPLPLLILTAPGHVALTLAILARGLVTGRAGPTWAGLKAGLKGLGAMRGKGRYAAPKRTISLGRLMRSMAWSPARLLDRRPVIRALPSDMRHDPAVGLATAERD